MALCLSDRRDPVSNVSLYAWVSVCVSLSKDLAPFPGLPSLRVDTFGLAPGVQGACGEKMNCVCVRLLQGLPENGTWRGGEGQREFIDSAGRGLKFLRVLGGGGAELQLELEGDCVSAQGPQGGTHI